jgi:hypothetical protein
MDQAEYYPNKIESKMEAKYYSNKIEIEFEDKAHPILWRRK